MMPIGQAWCTASTQLVLLLLRRRRGALRIARTHASTHTHDTYIVLEVKVSAASR